MSFKEIFEMDFPEFTQLLKDLLDILNEVRHVVKEEVHQTLHKFAKDVKNFGDLMFDSHSPINII